MNTTLDIVPAGLALLDSEGRVLSATPGFSRLLGFDESPVGHELGDLLCTLDDSDGVEQCQPRGYDVESGIHGCEVRVRPVPVAVNCQER